jgi:GPH family glycoside/pentoside/hexuronide:cation symporter
MKDMLWRYASMRLPLAILELPLYVLLPKLFSELLPLSLVGLMLLAARGLDALADPWLGRRWDLQSSVAGRQLRQRAWWALAKACAVFTVGFMLLLWWSSLAKAYGIGSLWSATVLAIGSVGTYLAYSQCSIIYQSWGAALARSDRARSRYALSREAAGLIGVMAVSVFVQAQSSFEKIAISGLLIVFTLLALALFRGLAYPTHRLEQREPARVFNARSLWEARPMRHLFICFMLSAIAAAIPATLVLFFVERVLEMPQAAPWFLLLYFLSAALGLPLWSKLSDRFGHSSCWLLAMLIAIGAFLFCLGLEAGDAWAYALVCIVTGLALGGDVAMPWAILLRLIEQQQKKLPTAMPISGRCIGYWTLVGKLNLALAAGIALPLWQWLGEGVTSLSWIYAGLPCALKCISMIWLVRNRGREAL